MLIRQPLNNLIGGVSQQADAVKPLDKSASETNTWSSITEGCVKRPPTEYIKKLATTPDANAKYHHIYRQVDQQYTLVINSSSGNIQVYTNLAEGSKAAGAALTVTYAGGVGTGYIGVTSAKATIKCMTVADYTFLLNTGKTCAMDSGTLTSAISNTTHAYIFVRQGNYRTKYKVRMKRSGTDQTVETLTYNGSNANAGELNSIKTEDIAEDLRTKLAAAWGSSTFTRKGSVIKVTDTVVLTALEPLDSIGDSTLSVVWKTVPRVQGALPDICTDGFKIKVVGTEEINADDYFVKFIADESGGFGHGHWQEDLDYSQAYNFDTSSMPHTLARKYDLTGATAGYIGPYFELAVGVWENKLTGDSTLNPSPSFIGKTIAGMFFYKERLGFLADDKIVMSETSHPFNFWRTTLLTLEDSAPIDVNNNNYPVALCKSAIGYNENLICKSVRGQFSLHGGDILSPRTVQITPAAQFESFDTVDPIFAGRSLFFPFKRGDFSGVREFFQVGDANLFDSADITTEVPAYIEGDIEYMAVSTLEETLVVKGTTNANALYAYKWVWSGNEKVLSAWRKWVFDYGITIKYFSFAENTLWMINSYADGVYLEKMKLTNGLIDTGTTFLTYLDRRADQSQVTGIAYSSGSNTTTFTLPYVIPASISSLYYYPIVVQKLTGTIYTYVSHTTTTLTVAGNCSALNFWVGHSYPQSYIFSQPVIKRPVGRGVGPDSGAKMVAKFLWLEFKGSGPFPVFVRTWNKTTYTYTVNELGTTLKNGTIIYNTGLLHTDRAKIPLHGRPEELQVEVLNFYPSPANLLNAVWVVQEYIGASLV